MQLLTHVKKSMQSVLLMQLFQLLEHVDAMAQLPHAPQSPL